MTKSKIENTTTIARGRLSLCVCARCARRESRVRARVCVRNYREVSVRLRVCVDRGSGFFSMDALRFVEPCFPCTKKTYSYK